MCNSSELVSHQIALVRLIQTQAKELSQEWKELIYSEVNKDLRTEKIQNGRKNSNSDYEPATKAQIKFAKNLKIPTPENYSKRELSKLIEQAKHGGNSV